MTRRPLTILLAAALALTATATAVAAAPFPTRIQLPSGWMPEGITAGAGTTIYVGSLAGGGVWRGDVRTGLGDRVRAGLGWRGDGRRVRGDGEPPVGRRRPDRDRPRLRRDDRRRCSGRTRSRPRASSTTSSSPMTAVYVTDSYNAWLDVIPLGPNGELPATGCRHDAAVDRDHFEPGQFNANGIVATRGWLLVVDSFTGGLFRVDPRDGDRDRGLDRRHERDQRGWPRAARIDALRGAQRRPARGGVPARSGPDRGEAAGRDQLAGPERADDRGGPGRPAVGRQRAVRDHDRRLLGRPGADAPLGVGHAGRLVAIATPLVVVTEFAATVAQIERTQTCATSASQIRRERRDARGRQPVVRPQAGVRSRGSLATSSIPAAGGRNGSRSARHRSGGSACQPSRDTSRPRGARGR